MHRACLILSYALLLAGAGAAEPVFWKRDGTGNFPEATPPAAFDGETGKNIRWKTALPNWSNSSPIVVDTAKGPRVILVAEPLDYAPLLLCVDADTGKELWRRELDAVPLLPEAEQAAARELAKKGWAAARLRKSLTGEIQALYEKNKDAWKDRANPPAEAAPIIAKAKAAGLEYRGTGQSAGGYPNHLYPAHDGPWQQDHRKLTELGLMWSNWDYQGTWDGVGYPTPISDGQRIWTVTSHNLYSCHDMNGDVIWQKRFSPPRLADLTPEQKKALSGEDGKLRWPGDWPGWGNFSTSPIMAEGKLVSSAGMMIRCLDARDGAVLWSHPTAGGINMAVPGFAVSGGERFVVGVDKTGSGSNVGVTIYRLRDGARVGRLSGIVSANSMNGPLTEDDRIVNRDGNAIVARRLVRNGETVAFEPLWSQADKSLLDWSFWRAAWREGRAYHGGGVVDLREGKVIASRRAPVNQGYYGQGGILVGPVFLLWDFYHGKFVWTDPATGTKLGEGQLPVNPADGKPRDFKREQAGRDDWRWLSGATPFAWKDRLYVRAYDLLWCLGPR